MKMDRMVEYLENRGFKAKKEYNKFDKAYVFTVTKNGLSVMDSFVYPANADYSVVDEAQRKFLDHMIDYWKRTFEKPNNLITWFVESIEVHNESGCRPNVLAEINGVLNGPKFAMPHGYIEGLRDRITAKLNDLDTFDPTPKISNVIFNPPATIVFWADGTKTVVKTQEGETFDPEKGLAMAISKKALGNQGNYFNQIKKCTEKYENDMLIFNGKNFKESDLTNAFRELFGLPKKD